jgi:hypothetical protein
MLEISFNFITGLTFGLEQDSGDDEDDYSWVVALHLGIIRFIVIKYKPEA